jgi:PAS domain S-box-containing protein
MIARFDLPSKNADFSMSSNASLGMTGDTRTGNLPALAKHTEVSDPDAINARLRSVLEGMSEGFSLLSPDFIILDVNAEALRLDARTRDEIIGRSLWDVYPGTEQGPRGPLYKKAMRDRVALNLEHEHTWRDGRSSWLDIRAYPTDDGCLAVFFRDVTDRRVAEQAARASADRFEGAVRAFADVLWTNDANGGMRGEQPGWAALTGQSYDEYQGYGWSDAVHPDDALATVEAWNAAVADRRLFVFEHRVRRHDGVWRRFAIRAAPVLNEDGSIREWVGVHSDITDLRESEVRFRQLAENIDVVFYLLELDDQRISYVSPAYERIWQQSAETLYGDFISFTRVIHPDDIDIVDAAMKLQMAGENTAVRYRLVLPGGEIRHIHDRGFVTVNPYGDGRRVVGIAEDVTETTSALLQLAANAATFEAMVRNNPFGLHVVDSNFRLLHASIGTMRVFADIDPLIGRDFAELLRLVWPEPYVTENIERFHHTLKTGETYINHNTREQRHNVERSDAYDWRIDRILLPDGTLGVVCYFYDLTERLALEAQLTQALADKDMLLREIDHRVRNSMTMIASLLSMQGGASTSAEVKNALQVASARLIAVARIHERLYKGKEIGIVEFGTYLEEICHDLQSSLGHSDMTIAMDVIKTNLLVDQAVSLGLIANELVTNAFKHCDDSTAVIHVRLRREEATLSLTVTDTGKGIPADHDPQKHAGLGMQVIDLLTRQLGGVLTRPAAGREAKFEIHVPLND